MSETKKSEFDKCFWCEGEIISGMEDSHYSCRENYEEKEDENWFEEEEDEDWDDAEDNWDDADSNEENNA
jgi:hypothetical protein